MLDAIGLYHRWIEAWNGNLDLIPGLVTPGFVIHQVRQDGQPSEDVRGPEALASLIHEVRDPFPDIGFTIEIGPITTDDFVAARWSGEGTYGGGMPGADIPEGALMRFAGHDILRLEGERFAEYWAVSVILP